VEEGINFEFVPEKHSERRVFGWKGRFIELKMI
jgi:hypothetical protein